MRKPKTNPRAPRNRGKGKAPRTSVWKPIFLVIALTVILAAGHAIHLENHWAELQSWVHSFGPWGPVAFVLIYTLWVAVALPVTPPAFLSGFLFGTVTGVVVSNLGATLGACLAFLIARYFAREAVENWIQGYPAFRKWDESTAKNGVGAVILCRLLPLLPFNLTNYAFGLTRIGFWPYAFWSWLCMIPAIVVYVAGAQVVERGLLQGKIPWGLAGILAALALFLAWFGIGLKKKMKW